MVSWEASAKMLMELSDEQSARDGALVRAAAGLHASEESNWVYVCPPSWNITPKEFAAACHYSLDEGMTWRDVTGGLTGAGVLAMTAVTPTSGLTVSLGLAALPVIVALPGSAWLQRRLARVRVERMKNAGLNQVLEVARDEFDGHHVFHDDLAAADALKPGEMTELRHRALARLWLSAGGDPTIADTLPDKGWVSRSSAKKDSHWANRAILDIAGFNDRMSSLQKRTDALTGHSCDHPDEINSPDCMCAICESEQHDDNGHYEHQRPTASKVRRYEYVAQDAAGREVRGTSEAESRGAVTNALFDSGLKPLRIAAPDDASQSNPFTPTAPPARRTATRPAAKPTTMAGRWADALARFEVVEKEWEEIVTDPLAALDHAPLLDMRLMPDGSMSRTGIFLEAFGKAQDLQRRHAAHSPATGPEDRADVVEFEDAVRAADVAWTEAKRWAKHVGIDSLPESERDIARRARAALKKAMHEFTPIEEAITAAETAARLLKSIHTVVLPEKAMLQIETKARKAIG
jgi:hypothetical protein